MLRGSRSRILIVEPDRRVREFLADALRDSAEITQAAGPIEAMRSLSRASDGSPAFDIAIVDCGAPESRDGAYRGVELVRLIAAQGPRVAVVAMSAAAESERIAAEAFRCGARDFLKKPFGMSELTNVIARLTAARDGGSGTQAPSPRIRNLF